MGHQQVTTKKNEITQKNKGLNNIRKPLLAPGPANPLMQLQQTAGNQAVQGLLRSGLNKNQPGQITENNTFGILELKGMTKLPSEPVTTYLNGLPVGSKAKINVSYGNVARGLVEVEKNEDRQSYKIVKQAIPFSHPLFINIREIVPGLEPKLIFSGKEGGPVTGYVGLCEGSKLPGSNNTITTLVKDNPAIFGLQGFDLNRIKDITNKLEDGKLSLGIKNTSVDLNGVFAGTVTLEAVDEKVNFDGKATISAKGLGKGDLSFSRSDEGVISGSAALDMNLTKNVTGTIKAQWDGQRLNAEGMVAYQGEKLSGQVGVKLTDKNQLQQTEQGVLVPQKTETPLVSPGKGKKPQYVVLGEGDLNFTFTDWLSGTAHVIIDERGAATITGKITPQKEVLLFEQKDFNKKLLAAEVRAVYGMPVVGNIFIFGNIEINAFAKVGPGKLYNITVEGTYSTDPGKCKGFSIQGSLNISAAAGLNLRGEAGAGLEIIDHDIKAGAGINALAGVRGYVEATPVIGYRERDSEGQDKKGEFFIRGNLELAAQPVLGLKGDLFVEVDSPFWSPLPDKKWTWPLAGKEWPIGGSFGINASMDYVIGSKQWPTLEFKAVQFSADKFMTDLYSDKAKSKSGDAGDQKGKWAEKNTKSAEPPPKQGKKGSAEEGPAPKQSPAAPKVKPGGSKKVQDEAPLNAKTIEGKTKKELQEALKKDKDPVGKSIKKVDNGELAKSKSVDFAAAKQVIKNTLNTSLPKGARQIADVNKVLAGVVNKVKSTLTGLHAEEVRPGKPKEEGAIGFKVVAKDKKGIRVVITEVRYAKEGGILSHEERWQKGAKEVKRAVERLKKHDITEENIRAQLPRWESEFGFSSLTLNTKETPWVLEGAMSPKKRIPEIFISPSKGVSEAPQVESEFTLNGRKYKDVNPTARNPRPKKGEPIKGLSAINSNTKFAHAEIGAMNQALKEGNKGGKGVLKVKGLPVCTYCKSDIKKMAEKLKLNELRIIDETGTYKFTGPDDFKNVSDGGKKWRDALQ